MPTHVNIKDFGALGDAMVATDCSMTAGQNVLTSASARFKLTDVGKVIAVYGAGNQVQTQGQTFQQPLSSIIVGFQDSQNVVLQDLAGATTANSFRVVYGHDDTTAIQTALDELTVPDGQGGNIGGVLAIPEGHYLTHGLNMSGSVTGNLPFGPGTVNVPKAYNNIWLRGSGRGGSVLENWDVAVCAACYAAIIGLNLKADPVPPNRRLSNIIISDLTIRQVLNAGNVVHAIYDTYSEYVQVRDCEIISGSYEGVQMSNNSQRWSVTGCDLHDCGIGGPRDPNGLSALNLGGSDWIAESNEVRESGLGIEWGGHNNRVVNNRFYAPTSPMVTEYAGVSIQSSNNGGWDCEFINNLFVGWGSPLIIQNGNGVVCRSLIQGNHFDDCGGVQISSGLEQNGYGYPTYPDKVHGITIVKDNVLRRVKPSLFAFQMGIQYMPQSGLESVIFEGNVAFEDDEQPKGFLQVWGSYGGGEYWVTFSPTYDPLAIYQLGDLVVPTNPAILFRYRLLSNAAGPAPEPQWPMTIAAVVDDTGTLNGGKWDCVGVRPYSSGDLVVPSTYNGCYYRCVKSGIPGATEPVWPSPPVLGASITDGAVVWVCEKRPFVRLRSNSLIAPPGATSSGFDVSFEEDATHEIAGLPLTSQNLWGNYPLGYYDWINDPNGILQLIPGCG
jgi:hypothetical protein